MRMGESKRGIEERMEEGRVGRKGRDEASDSVTSRGKKNNQPF